LVGSRYEASKTTKGKGKYMLSFYTYDLSTLLLLVLLGVALWSDLRRHRISNKLNLLILSSGLLLQTFFVGMDGLISGLLGLAVGFVIFIPFYLLGGFGAGDVKLMAVVGTFLGPEDTLLAAGLSLYIGAAMGLIILLAIGGFKTYLSRYWTMLKTFFLTRQLVYQPPQAGEAAATRFPYAAAITAGTFTALLWLGMMDLSGVMEFITL